GSLQGLFAAIQRLCEASDSGDRSSAFEEAATELVAQAKSTDLAFLLDEVPKAIAQSLEGIRRVSRIVKAMKEFSHPGHEMKVAVDINRAIETTLIVAQNELKYVAETVSDFDADLPPVECLPGDINQVVLNLLINAAHAMADNASSASRLGRLTVATRQ